jgi:hypothetical protein
MDGNAFKRMALGKRKAQQYEIFIPTAQLAARSGYPFYSKVTQ